MGGGKHRRRRILTIRELVDSESEMFRENISYRAGVIMQYCKSSGKSVPGLTNEKDKGRRLCGETSVSDQGAKDRTNMRLNRSRHFLSLRFVWDDALDVVSGASRTNLDILHLAKSRQTCMETDQPNPITYSVLAAVRGIAHGSQSHC